MSKNMSKEKEKTSSGVADKVIKFLGLNKLETNRSGSTIGTQSSCNEIFINQIQIEYELTDEQKLDICRKSSINTRIKTIKELEDILQCKRLVDFSIEYIIKETVDLLDENQTTEVRHSVWKFYKSLVCGQREKLMNLRSYLLEVIIINDTHQEDIPQRLDLLVGLTENGKNIEYLEARIGRFIVEWFDEVVNTVPKITPEFLGLLTNLIKFNAAYFDQSIISNIILRTCQLTNRVTTTEQMKSCYQILDVVLCYSNLPSQTLTQFVIVLCKGVNINVLNEICVKIMKNLLGTHLGHSCVDTLRYLLCDQMNHDDISLIRGSIHFLTQSLWDQMRVESLKHSPNSILPAYKCALECKNPFVALEVTLSIVCYIHAHNHDISEHAWDLILDICDAIVSYYDISINNTNKEFPFEFHKLLDIIEELNENKHFYGHTDRLFDILEKCSIHRSVRYSSFSSYYYL